MTEAVSPPGRKPHCGLTISPHQDMSSGPGHHPGPTATDYREGHPGMNTVRLTASPRAHGCRAWGGCTPDVRCLEHRDAEPVPIVDLYPLVLDVIVPRPYGRPRLRLIKGGKR